MKQNPNFILNQIENVPYLLPVGQAIANHMRGLKTNATGVYIWNMLKSEHTLENVLSNCASHYEIPDSQLSEFRQDITQFLQKMCSLGIILTDSEETPDTWQAFRQLHSSREASFKSNDRSVAHTGCNTYLLSIGGLIINLICPQEAFPKEFVPFLLPGNTAKPYTVHQNIVLHQNHPEPTASGTVLLCNTELSVFEQEQQYLLYFPSAKNHLEIHLMKDGSTAHCYSVPPYNSDFRYNFFHSIRLIYLYLAAQHQMVALHSASILYQNKLWLFSGQSGTGKSTHTNLWNSLYNTPIINGDLNLLAIDSGQPVVHGIPWCGTSGINSTQTYSLGGIILLKQANDNHIEQLAADQQILSVVQRLISPVWNKDMQVKNISLICKLSKQILICKLHCTKEQSSVDTIKFELDTFLNNTKKRIG